MLLGNIINSFLLLSPLFQLVVIFIFSAIVGSFLNVVIYRLPIMLENEWESQAREILELPKNDKSTISLTKPRSQCRECGRSIRAIENIPIFSYLFMKGKCKGCKKKISIFYPLVELLTAIVSVFVFWHFGANLQGLFAIFFVFALITLSGIDFKTQLLPDIITIPLLWAGIIISFWGVFIPLKTAVIGALFGYLILWFIANIFKLLFKKEGMGLGDVKLLAAIFTWVNIEYLPLVLLIACIIGSGITIIQRLMSGSRMTNNPLPFGPYLAFGGVVAMLYGEELVNWYTRFLFG